MSVNFEVLAGWVRHGENPEHEASRGDFGLTHPSAPHASWSLCDWEAVSARAGAWRLPRKGIRRGLVSEKTRRDLPQNV